MTYKPRSHLDARNISVFCAPAWSPAPSHMIKDPIAIVQRRPHKWLTRGSNGTAITMPSEWIALSNPSLPLEGLSKSGSYELGNKLCYTNMYNLHFNHEGTA